VSLRGGRPLRRQIEAALSGEADPLGEDGLGLPDRPDGSDPGDMGDDFPGADGEAGEGEAGPPVKRGKRGKERHVDEAVRIAYQAAQAARAAAGRQAGGGAGAAVTARRLPDLHVLPPLLHASGAFAALRQRLGSQGGPLPPGGRHAALASVPHGAKTYLAAALALDGATGGTGERLCWIARDSEIGDRVA